MISSWGDWVRYAWYGAGALLVFLTLLPIARFKVWWVRVWEFPRLQAAVACGLLLLAGFWLIPGHPFGIRIMQLALAAALLWHLWWILPYTRWHRREIPDADPNHDGARISLLTANVLTPNRQADELLRMIRQWEPDIVLTLESDSWWEEKLNELHTTYPHSVCRPLDNLYGMHLFSRLPLIDPQVQYLVEPDIPSIHTLIELGDGQLVRAHFLHPAPPSPTENDESTERDAELLVVAKTITDFRHPVLVAGDLNDVAWSATSRLFRKISTLLDPRVGRGLLNTFHAGIPIVRFPLDHIFVSSHFLVRRLQRLPEFGSDHFPIFAEFQLVPPELGGTSELEADHEDRAEAREAIDSTDASPNDVHQPDPKAREA